MIHRLIQEDEGKPKKRKTIGQMTVEERSAMLLDSVNNGIQKGIALSEIMNSLRPHFQEWANAISQAIKDIDIKHNEEVLEKNTSGSTQNSH